MANVIFLNVKFLIRVQESALCVEGMEDEQQKR